MAKALEKTKTSDPPILQKGTGTPYLAIFNKNKEPVMNLLTNIPLGAYVSNFSYKFDEENHNEMNITFEVGNPDIIDQEDLQKGKAIYLQWGYIYADGTHCCNEPRTINIKDFDATFDQEGTHCLIKGMDGTAKLRNIPGIACGNSKEASMVNAMDEGFGLDQGIVIIKYD